MHQTKIDNAVTMEDFFGTVPAKTVPKGAHMNNIIEIESKLKTLPVDPTLPAALPIMTMLASRQRGRGVLTTGRVARLLKEQGNDVGAAAVSAVFTELSHLGLGKLIPGRGRYPRGIHWSYNQVSVGKTALFPNEHLSQQAVFRIKHGQPRRELMHTVTVLAKPGSNARIIVRRGSIEIDLPIDAPRQAVDNAVGAIQRE